MALLIRGLRFLVFLWVIACSSSTSKTTSNAQAKGNKKDELRVDYVVESEDINEEELSVYFENPETIDYSIIKNFVFEPGRCFQCHSQESPLSSEKTRVFGVDMSSYLDLFYRKGIVPGRPVDLLRERPEGGVEILQGSRIFQTVAVTQEMPPPEKGFRPLSSIQTKLLRLWILNCAIEDFSAIESDTLIEGTNNGEKLRRCFTN